jgi:hypothetical protein
MALKLIETTISPTAVRLRYADNSDPTKATQWMDIQAPIAELMEPRREQAKLGEAELQYLAELHRAVLQYGRHVINGEIQRLAKQAGRTV